MKNALFHMIKHGGFAHAARIGCLLALSACASRDERMEELMVKMQRQQELVLRRMEIDREARGDGYAENERLRRELAFEKEQRNLSNAAQSASAAQETFMRLMDIGKPRQ